ncbi:DUF262 domain-containing protein [Moraxella sp. PS-22]|uniref:DUF262 domain-containing protein n=1 Tax=Moraxella tetraodonis TaxID=2767221 RepID=A0A9X1UQI6_9GAMM|nr:DUF262 domain-containing protein [Moraxella tetraodonis]MCG8147147.1 DUF262 domain-containing protein [Moraxella tetraodonis]
MNYTDRIKPVDKGLVTYLEELKSCNYQIPTFQRDVVWQQENVKKLWDSIYKFYPLGSILVWKTDVQLSNHRQIGGHVIENKDFHRAEYQYLLDGQQRTTSLLTSLYGGKIEGRDDFDPALYVDLTITNDEDTDDESYKRRFLYWTEIDDKDGKYLRNTSQMRKFKEGLIVKLSDIKNNFEKVQEAIVNHPDVAQQYNHNYWVELRKLQQVLLNYRVSFIELKGIKVSEVCQIFERINQAGKPLEIFDIVVAKTFRPQSENDNGFYLRELIDNFKAKSKSRFMDIDYFDYLQIIAIIIRENIQDSGIRNITPTYLNNIKSEQIETVWTDTQHAILKTFDFFENTLNIKSPSLIPYRYFYLTIVVYFYQNKNPNYSLLKKYFWYMSFHNEDLLSNTSNINEHIALLNAEKVNGEINFGRFLIDKDKLRQASYSSKGRLSRAILSLYSYKLPKDWKFIDRNVNVDNIFISTDKPNLHHIFPINYIGKNKGENKLDENSLMNIAYLTQITNLEISDKNPLLYMQDYISEDGFQNVMASHLLPDNLLKWVELEDMPNTALDEFIEERVNVILNELENQLEGIVFDVIDTKNTDSKAID